MVSSKKSDSFWFLSLPLRHRESISDNPTIVEEDKNHLLSYLKEKLAASQGLAEISQISFPEFKVGSWPSKNPYYVGGNVRFFGWVR